MRPCERLAGRTAPEELGEKRQAGRRTHSRTTGQVVRAEDNPKTGRTSAPLSKAPSASTRTTGNAESDHDKASQ